MVGGEGERLNTAIIEIDHPSGPDIQPKRQFGVFGSYLLRLPPPLPRDSTRLAYFSRFTIPVNAFHNCTTFPSPTSVVIAARSTAQVYSTAKPTGPSVAW